MPKEEVARQKLIKKFSSRDIMAVVLTKFVFSDTTILPITIH